MRPQPGGGAGEKPPLPCPQDRPDCRVPGRQTPAISRAPAAGLPGGQHGTQRMQKLAGASGRPEGLSAGPRFVLAQAPAEGGPVKQKSIGRRLAISIPLFVITLAALLYSIRDKEGFNIVWRYFAWSNQTLAVFTLWAVTVYLTQKKKMFLVTLIPALFMTVVTVTYIFMAPEGFRLAPWIAYIIAGVVALIFLIIYLLWKHSFDKQNNA